MIDKSFLSSTVTRWSVSVLKTENMSCVRDKNQRLYTQTNSGRGRTYHGASLGSVTRSNAVGEREARLCNLSG